MRVGWRSSNRSIGSSGDAINWNRTVDYGNLYGSSLTDRDLIATTMNELRNRKDYHYNRANGLYG
jgi:hypothetical protein